MPRYLEPKLSLSIQVHTVTKKHRHPRRISALQQQQPPPLLHGGYLPKAWHATARRKGIAPQ